MRSLTCTFLRRALRQRDVEVGVSVPEKLGTLHTDTRTLGAGQLFLALVGERFDAHSFVSNALKLGASAVIAERHRLPAGMSADALVLVDDTLLALQDIARAHLESLPAKRLALTGSNGKTTTKELAAAALRECFGQEAVWATRGNLNNHIGVPLTALEVHASHQAVIFEMGMNHLEEIATLTRIVQPRAGLITQIGTAHAGNVGGIEGVARAKGELFAELTPDAIAIVNADDPRCVAQVKQHGCEHQITFGLSEAADVRILESQPEPHGGTAFTLGWQGEVAQTSIPLDGIHNVRNAAGAVALCMAIDVDFHTAARGLARARGIGGRLQRKTADCGALILDDTYNANPDSMQAGLLVLTQVAGARRRIAALGEMREVDAPEASHLAVGRYAVEQGVSLLFACGEAARFYIDGALEAGLPADSCVWATDSSALSALVASAVHADDVVLVKGSRGARMEVVVDGMTKRPDVGERGES